MKNLYYIMSRANYNQHDVMYMLSNAEVIYKVNTQLSEEQLEKVFGTADVDLKTRAEHFGNLWDEWEKNQVIIPNQIHKGIQRYKLELEYLDVKATAKNFTDKHGLEEMIDYQIKGNVVRFKDEQYAFLFRLSV